MFKIARTVGVILVLLAVGVCQAPETTTVLKQLAKLFGDYKLEDYKGLLKEGEREIVFEQTDYRLKPIFDSNGVLSGLHVSPAKDLLQSKYELLLSKLDTFRSLGALIQADARWSWGMNGMTTRIDHYEKVVTDRCDVNPGYKKLKEPMVGWFSILYPHQVTGKAINVQYPHVPVQSAPDNEGNYTVEMETPDWSLAEITLDDGRFLFETRTDLDIKVGDTVKIRAFGPLDNACGAL
jgi:hypothetical protein